MTEKLATLLSVVMWNADVSNKLWINNLSKQIPKQNVEIDTSCFLPAKKKMWKRRVKVMGELLNKMNYMVVISEKFLPSSDGKSCWS